jgi:hypothetical protein
MNTNAQAGAIMYNPTHSGHLPQDFAKLLTSKEPLKQFLTARYFQVHFEFLQEQIQLMPQMQEAMLMQMNQMQQCLLAKPQILLTHEQHHSMATNQTVKQSGLHTGSKHTKKG